MLWADEAVPGWEGDNIFGEQCEVSEMPEVSDAPHHGGGSDHDSDGTTVHASHDASWDSHVCGWASSSCSDEDTHQLESISAPISAVVLSAIYNPGFAIKVEDTLGGHHLPVDGCRAEERDSVLPMTNPPLAERHPLPAASLGYPAQEAPPSQHARSWNADWPYASTQIPVSGIIYSSYTPAAAQAAFMMQPLGAPNESLPIHVVVKTEPGTICVPAGPGPPRPACMLCRSEAPRSSAGREEIRNRKRRTMKRERADNKIGMWWRKYGYAGPRYCQRCSELFRDHIIRQYSNTARCSRQRPCTDCAKVLMHMPKPLHNTFAVMDAARTKSASTSTASKRNAKKKRKKKAKTGVVRVASAGIR